MKITVGRAYPCQGEQVLESLLRAILGPGRMKVVGKGTVSQLAKRGVRNTAKSLQAGSKNTGKERKMGKAWQAVVRSKAPKPVMPVVRKANRDATVQSQQKANTVARTQIAKNAIKSAPTAGAAIRRTNVARRRGVL